MVYLLEIRESDVREHYVFTYLEDSGNSFEWYELLCKRFYLNSLLNGGNSVGLQTNSFVAFTDDF